MTTKGSKLIGGEVGCGFHRYLLHLYSVYNVAELIPQLVLASTVMII